ncbi:MAG: 50S ribosomal protein L1 [Patescibacteria group bacterium]
MARNKKYQEIKKKIDPSKIYSLDEAIDFIKKNPAAKFDESIEIHITLDIDPSKTEQQIHGSVILPAGTVKKRKIVAFVTLAKREEAKQAGVDIVGGIDLIEKINETGKCDFDMAIAEPAMMKDLARIAKILGPKGLMPNPKSETITTDIKKTVKELTGGKINFKNDPQGIIHQAIGKVSWPVENIKKNALSFLEAVKKAKPQTVKGNFIKNITISSTMGPSIKIQI